MILIWWYISDFFNFIWDSLVLIFDWLQSVVNFIIDSSSFLLDIALELPTILNFTIIILVSVSVVYKFLGRSGQD